MKITKRQLRRIIKEETARVLAEQLSPEEEYNAAYDLLMGIVTDELYAGPHGEPATRERIQAWMSALADVRGELELEMPDRDESEFITLRDPRAGE